MSCSCDWKMAAAVIAGAGVAGLGVFYAGYKLGVVVRSRGPSLVDSVRGYRGSSKNHSRKDPLALYLKDHNVENPVLSQLREISRVHKEGMLYCSIK